MPSATTVWLQFAQGMVRFSTTRRTKRTESNGLDGGKGHFERTAIIELFITQILPLMGDFNVIAFWVLLPFRLHGALWLA